ncbi:hypothetical protein DFH08DRAFT_1077499 [Mycena albidolilacea]|uniref:F-box domain-containing protein n=1 Tax=Mycena albidolilacea TaxID=1033008 RepID=A0AAD7EXL5_9AGAR|nr:hypothetical protein DFH08DRAFT_1077499 [Mycena albidolilacea]
MSSATWRSVFTYNKHTQITARAVRNSLQENQRLTAEKRGLTALSGRALTGDGTSIRYLTRKSCASSRSRIADIEAQISELERTLSSLKEEKDSIRDRLATYAYPVLTLPGEIVSEIFVHFLPDFPRYPPPIGLLSPYLLCQICREWRDIALATPALWSVISLSFREDGRFPQKLRYLQTSIERSGSCRLSLKLGTMGTSLAHKSLAVLNHVVINHFHRVEYLDLSSWSGYEFPTYTELSLPCLRGLKFGDLPEEPATPLVAPVLHQVVLHYFGGIGNSFFPWSQLTAITVAELIELGEYGYLMNELINIVHCRLSIYPAGHLSLGDITLAHLETCILENPSRYPAPSGIIATLTLPALRRFQIAETLFADKDDPVDSITALVTRSGCNLRELSITDANTAHITAYYHDAFPSTSLTFSPLDITEPFLMRWQDGPEDTESSDSDDESEGTDSED